jgi:NAD(P)-dependent dehydrogenase (short-subunit alcohol dehydrogenase family)
MATQALAANGAKVYITGRTKEKLDNVVSTYGQDIAGEIIALTADISTKEGVSSLYDSFSQREKCLCILINNAGISSKSLQTESSSADEMRRNLFDDEKNSYEDWNTTYNTNVTGTYFTTTAFLPLLQRSSESHRGWSSTVINISSISGLIKTAQHHFAYNASKGAAVHLTRLLAGEISANNLKIRVNGIAPGVFPSEMTAKDSDDKQKSQLPKEDFEGKVPAHRPGKDEDMAGAVLFFATNQYTTGQTLAVDGGYTLAAGM